VNPGGAGQGDGPELRYGFSYGHVQALAKSAVRGHAPSLGMDASDRFEAAWGAIAEHLYAADEPPTPLDLIRAGRNALSLLRLGALRQRGYAGRDPAAGAGSAPGFCRYWHNPVPPTPEDLVVDWTALRQVMAGLKPVHARALLALAEHGDYQRAAAALGVPDATFYSQVGRARAAFLALWHEHETPSRMWRQDKRVSSRRALRSQPAGPADAARTLADIRDAFGEATRAASLDLLVRLATASPARYGDWDPADLSGFLRRHAVARHKTDFLPGRRRTGQRSSRCGYRLEDITTALTELTAPARQAA
jgi:DNA-directed RNA polymerase specialized sigma24 family protein